MTTFLVIVLIAAVVVAIGVFALRRSRAVPVPIAPARPAAPARPVMPAVEAPTVMSEPSPTPHEPEPEPELPDPAVALAASEIRWSKRFDPPSGPLDDEARLKLIRDLGFVRGEWCIPLLAQAYEEETSAEHRRAVLTALAAYRHPDTRAMFEQALRSHDEEERRIATTALAGS